MQERPFVVQKSRDMVDILREYGLLFVLAVVGILSFFLVRNQGSDALEQSLDAVGMQLLSVVGDGEARDAVAGLYDRFKARVLRKEVAPEQVEQLAANILNLRRSGYQLTAEEAEGVFEIVLGSEVDGPVSFSGSAVRAESGHPVAVQESAGRNLPHGAADTESIDGPRASVSPPAPPVARRKEGPFDPKHFEGLGERLQILLDLTDVLDHTQAPGVPPSPEFRRYFDVRSEDGTRVLVDVKLKEALSHRPPRDVDRLVRRMESARMLTWTEDVEESRVQRERFREEAAQRGRDLQSILQDQGQAMQHQLGRLARYRALQAKGITIPFNIDSLELVIRLSVEEMVRATQPPPVFSPRPPSLP